MSAAGGTGLPPKPSPPTPQSTADRAAFAQLVAASLTDTRAAAEKWRAGLAALITLATTALLVKGPGEAADLPFRWRVGVTGVLGLGMALALFGLWQALAAATGVPSTASYDDIVREHGSVIGFQLAAAGRAAERLHWARLAVIASLVLFSAGIGGWWWAPGPDAKPAKVVATTSTGTVCGSLLSADGGQLRITVAGESVPHVIPFDRLRNLATATSC